MPSGGLRVTDGGTLNERDLKPGASRSKRHPADPSSGPRYTQTQVTPTRAQARGTEIRQ
jgi:hypothetical protein